MARGDQVIEVLEFKMLEAGFYDLKDFMKDMHHTQQITLSDMGRLLGFSYDSISIVMHRLGIEVVNYVELKRLNEKARLSAGL